MHNKKNNNNKNENFIQGLRPFSRSIPHDLKKILRKSGYNFSNIVDNWTKMVGDRISRACYPIKIKVSNKMKNGILIVNVIHGKELEVEYSKKEIIESINNFFGYNLVNEIKLKIIREKKTSEKFEKKNNLNNKFDKSIRKIHNDNLKDSLNKLVKAFSKKYD